MMVFSPSPLVGPPNNNPGVTPGVQAKPGRDIGKLIDVLKSNLEIIPRSQNEDGGRMEGKRILSREMHADMTNIEDFD
jgi:hypothetical protein